VVGVADAAGQHPVAADGGIEDSLVEAFHEEATIVAEDLRLQDQHVGNGGGNDVHQ